MAKQKEPTETVFKPSDLIGKLAIFKDSSSAPCTDCGGECGINLLMIFSIDEVKSSFLTLADHHENVSYNISYLNIDQSLDRGKITSSNVNFSTLGEFLNTIELLEPEAYVEYQDELDAINHIIMIESQTLANIINTNARIFGSLRELIKDEDESENESGTLSINNNSGTEIANVVFTTLDGDVKALELTTEDIQKVGNIIVTTIIQNLDIDTKDKKQVGGLKDLIQLRVIEGLPTKLKADTIKINEEKIISEVKRFKLMSENDDI